MAFDFEDLDEAFQLPPEFSHVQCMSEEEFATFGERIRKAERIGKYEDFDQAIVEALWDDTLLESRVPRVVAEFVALARNVARDDKAAKYIDRSGAAIMHTLFHFSISLSQHEVRVRQGDAGTACVLILGFGGSHVEELEPQVRFYRSQGYSVISMSCCTGPTWLAGKQSARLAYELRIALSRGSGSLHLHICSHGGYSRWSDVGFHWLGQLVPFHELPPLEDCLTSIVIECAPECMTHPYTGEVIPAPGSPLLEPKEERAVEEAAPKPEAQSQGHAVAAAPEVQQTQDAGGHEQANDDDDIARQVHEAETNHRVMVMLGCIGALCKRFSPDSEWSRLLYVERKFMPFLRGAAEKGPFWLYEDSRRASYVPGWGACPLDPVAQWDVMDMGAKTPVPRLFLYSTEDKLIFPFKVEAYIKHTERCIPSAKLFVQKCTIAPHCKLFDVEPEACAGAVVELLAFAGLQPQWWVVGGGW